MLIWVEKYCYQDVRITITSLLLKRTIQPVRQILLSTTGSQLENHWTVIFIIWTPASYMAEAIHSQHFIHILSNGDENIMAKRCACFLSFFPPFCDKCYFYQCYVSLQEAWCRTFWISEDSMEYIPCLFYSSFPTPNPALSLRVAVWYSIILTCLARIRTEQASKQAEKLTQERTVKYNCKIYCRCKGTDFAYVCVTVSFLYI